MNKHLLFQAIMQSNMHPTTKSFLGSVLKAGYSNSGVPNLGRGGMQDAWDDFDSRRERIREDYREMYGPFTDDELDENQRAAFAGLEFGSPEYANAYRTVFEDDFVPASSIDKQLSDLDDEESDFNADQRYG